MHNITQERHKKIDTTLKNGSLKLELSLIFYP